MLLRLAALILFATFASCQKYFISAPSVVRPGRNFTLSVSILSAPADVQVTASLLNKMNASQAQVTATVSTAKPTVMSIVAPLTLADDEYSVRVEGSIQGSKWSFSNQTTLTLQSKSVSIFIQLDKAMYKPGDLVNFRALAVYSDLKPYTSPLDIEIYDPSGNKIRQWPQYTNNTYGVASLSMPLSDQPILGDWNVKVTCMGMTQQKSFTVAEYVLPRYEVTVTLPPFLLVTTGSFPISVSAMYTYGQAVKGSVCVMISNPSWYWPSYYATTIPPTPVVKKCGQLNSNGTFQFTQPYIDLKNTIFRYYYDTTPMDSTSSLNSIKGQTMLIQASVTENVTGIVTSSNTSISISSNPLNIAFTSSTPSTYKPGLAYTGYVQITQPDGTPPTPRSLLSSTNTTAQMMLSADVSSCFTDDQSNLGKGFMPTSYRSVMMYDIPLSGYVGFTMANLPKCDTIQFTTTVQTLDTTISAYQTVNSVKTLNHQGIQLSIVGTDAIIKPQMSRMFYLNATQTMTSCMIEVLSKGIIQYTTPVDMEVQKSKSFTLTVDDLFAQKLAPNARMVAWCLTSTGEVVADSIELSVDGAFANKVNVSFAPGQVEPADLVSLKVSAAPSSYVGLLAVDKSVRLLKTGNDISQSDVMSELSSYDTSPISSWPPYPMPFVDFIIMPRFTGGSDTGAIFDNAGIIVMTDAFVYVSPPVFGGCGFDGRCFFPGVANRGDAGIAAGGAVGMPGMAGPAGPVDSSASSQGATNSAPVEPTKTRSLFPETWIWMDAFMPGGSSVMTMNLTVPDTITSWVASCFAVNMDRGLGVAADTAELVVTQPFFTSLNMPYSIIRGEQTVLQVLISNYLPTEQKVLVTLLKSAAYKVSINGAPATSVDATQNIMVPAYDVSSVSFWIVPQTLGQVEFTVKAQSSMAADQIKKTLLVEPEGVPQEWTEPYLIKLDNTQKTWNTTVAVSAKYPSNVVAGSQWVEVTAVGDIMGPSINGLDNLLQMPYGCGEQNMLNFAPDIYIMDYLVVSGRDTPDIRTKAINYMTTGYQRELTYRRMDYSFSAFGDSDYSGSTWLSAFVLKSFAEARNYIYIDQDGLARTSAWIMRQQNSNGSFNEPGRVIDDIQGGSGGAGPGMTAYVLIALLEAGNVVPTGMTPDAYRLKRNSTLKYLESQFDQIKTQNDNYTLALLAYTLQLANSSKATEAFNRLKAMAINKNAQRYWSNDLNVAPTPTSGPWFSWYPPRRSNDIEMTAYALLTYTLRGEITDGIPIMKWLVAQRNGYGGFASTQDTVVGLQALGKFAQNVIDLGSLNLMVQLKSSSMNGPFSFDKITKTDSVLLQSYELASPTDTSVVLTVSGMGWGLVTVNWRYNILQPVVQPSIEVKVSSIQKGSTVLVHPCVRWTDNKTTSGMAILKVGLLSGYTVDTSGLLDQYAKFGLRRVDVGQRDITLYFDQFNSTQMCLDILTQVVDAVGNLQPAAVQAYSYYSPEKINTAFYGGDLTVVNQCASCAECCAPTVIGKPATSTTRTTTRSTAKPTTNTTTKKPNTTTVKPTKKV